ncbi:hypothetical protein O181_091365 [Austropuccinia psidii MF-1]|uniref:Reverse transcriptase/retrotransposon-derived protein RNase H-like domain-containing protein n=1 Tax=Austropuccinia psidii MF-1 TaxID=1389203 RepID=A0A9Q3IXM3_9BASI|nr:hypothetical protein [Austropuccinia psidii MF-1]
MQSFVGFASYYRNHIKPFAHIASSFYKLCSKDVVFEITKERRDAYERIKYELTNAPLLILPYFELPFNLYIDAAFSQGLGAALHQRQIVDGEPRERVICYISGQLKHSEARWPLDNVKTNPAYDTEVAAEIPIHFMEINRKKNFRFSEWIPESATTDIGNTDSEGTETPILGISSSELHTEFFNAVMKTYAKHKQFGIFLQLLHQKYRSPELEYQLEEPWLREYKDNTSFLIDGLLYHREKKTNALTIIDRNHPSLIPQECPDCAYMGHMSEDRTKERVASTAWWPRWEQEQSEYIKTYERCQKENRKHGKKYG